MAQAKRIMPKKLHQYTKIGLWILVGALVLGVIKVLILAEGFLSLSFLEVVTNLQGYMGAIGIGMVLIGLWRLESIDLGRSERRAARAEVAEFQAFLQSDPANRYLSKEDQRKSFELWRRTRQRSEPISKSD